MLKDGITVADLVEQQNFLLQVRDTVAEASPLRTQSAAGDGRRRTSSRRRRQAPASDAVSDREAARAPSRGKLQALWARLVTAPGIYEQGMLLDQLNSISRVESGADQKVGNESRRRFDDLKKELKAIQAELAKIQ